MSKAKHLSRLIKEARDLGATVKSSDSELTIVLDLDTVSEKKEVKFNELPEAVQEAVKAQKKKRSDKEDCGCGEEG